MGKTNRGDKEYTRLQEALHENKRLKKQISSLRKQLARIDLDRYAHVKNMIEEHYKEDEAQEGRNIIEKLKKEWSCWHCDGGYLEIFTYTKIDETHYFRRCKCGHRTKSQIYTPSVKGIRHEKDEKD